MKSSGIDKPISLPRRGRSGSRSSATQDRNSLARLAPRVELVSRLRGSVSRYGLGVICSEPGMGAHVLMDLAAAGYHDEGYTVTRFRYSARSHDSSYRRLRRCLAEALTLVEQGDRPLVCIGDVERLTETAATRCARVVSSLVIAGAFVLIQLRTDSDILLERLPPTRVLRSVDLLVKKSELPLWPDGEALSSAGSVLSVTGGIASLVGAVAEDGGTQGVVDPVIRGSAWRLAMRELAHTTLGDQLVNEERSLRAALWALGSGTLGEVGHTGVRASLDLAESVGRDAPVLGLDVETGRFSCVPVDADLIADALRASLSDQQLDRLCSRLVERGEFRRAGSLLRGCLGEESWSRLVCMHPIEFIEAGEVDLVARVARGSCSNLGQPDRRGAGTGDAGSMRAGREMLARLGVTAAEPRPSAGADGASTTDRSQAKGRKGTHGLLCELARMCQEPPEARGRREPRSVLRRAEATGNVTCRALAALVAARALMAQGSALEAFRLLVASGDLVLGARGASGLTAALLRCEFELARMVVGDPARARDVAAFARADALLRASLGEPLTTARRGYRYAVAVLCGEDDGEGLSDKAGQLAAEFERAGDCLRGAIVRLASCVQDLGARSWRRAAVEAGQALDDAKRSGAADLGACAITLQRLALAATGDAIREQDLEWDPVRDDERCGTDMVLVARLSESLRRKDNEELRHVQGAMAQVVPRSEAQLFLSLLSRVDERMRPGVLDAIPAGWKERVRQPAAPPSARRAGGERRPGGVRGADDAIAVKVLGGVEVSCGGRSLPEGAWRRRSARTLLAMLALAPGHAVSRYEAAEALWPEASYARSRESLYSTLSALRHALGALGEGRYVQGEDGMIWLSRDLVSYDVDELRLVARVAMGRGASDEGAVAAGLRLEGLYAGGSWMPPSDVTGVFRRYHDELSTQYVDALAAAAESAWRMGQMRTCAWLARAAHLEAPLREDVATRLVEALGAGGREAEARDAYLAYVSRCVRDLGTPPSERIRQAGLTLLAQPGAAGCLGQDQAERVTTLALPT